MVIATALVQPCIWTLVNPGLELYGRRLFTYFTTSKGKKAKEGIINTTILLKV